MANISKIKVGTTEYNVKDSVLNAVGLAVKAITDVSEDASTEDLAKKMNEILAKFRTLTGLAVMCGLSLFGAIGASAADPVQPLTTQHKYIKGDVAMVTNQVEWISSLASNYVYSATVTNNTLYLTNYVNGVLTNYTFKGGSGSGSSISDGTNTLTAAGMWVTRTNATEGVAETNTLASTAAVTNIAELILADKVNTKACWSEENAWSLAYDLDVQGSTVTTQSYSTNEYYQVMLKTYVTIFYNLSADLYLKMLDVYSLSSPIITNYVCTTPGGSITSAGHLTAVSNCIYECYAQATDGDTQKVKIPLNSTVGKTDEKNYYYADVDGTGRKTVNDEALTLINAATSAGTGTYEGITYYKWNYFTQPAWAATCAGASGAVRQFAIGTKLMAGAAHYPWLSTGSQTVGSTTVTKGSWESLYNWALNNGWSKEELSSMYIKDISICVLTSGEIPLTDLPYLMSEDQYDALFPSTADEKGFGAYGVQAWSATQSFAQPNPAFIGYMYEYGSHFGNLQEDTYGIADTLRRRDINTAFSTKGLGYGTCIHGGDSGHPIYFRKGGKYVLLSHYATPATGPSYVKSLPVLKKYAEAHGSQLRLWDE